MKEDDEGFITPKVDEERCIKCGLCKKTCGQIDRFYNKNNLEERKFLGVRPKEKEIAKNSTSGGIAYLISKMVIEENGIVFGSAYDENLMPYQKYVKDKKELQQLRGSKYVTSDTKKTFSQVKEFLEEGKKILYIGVPCQIGGLKKFLKKDYENLYTIDIICHGVPSQKIFKKYLENEEKKLREKMGDAAIKAAKKVGYTSCGTIEFLVDKNKNFYFMEMNTRIQVEHGITEERTGIDIVKEQIRIAAGEKLKIKQKDVEFRGHVIECRINAENPSKNFRPSPGKITGLILPGGNGIRVDTFVYEGYTIPPNYDSMIAKIIAHGKTRNEAISKMKRALEETVIEGVDTNIDFLFTIIRNSNFLRGKYDTSFIEKEILK